MHADGCPRLTPLRILSRKWSYLILRELRDHQGFSELKGRLRFITSRMLSRELAILTQEELVDHKAGTYSLSSAGRALLDAAEPLMRWSVDHRNMRSCSPEQQCSRCALYPEALQRLARVK